MKYCTHCGEKVMDECVICPFCGCYVNGSSVEADEPSVGLNILGFLFPIVGLILYCVMYQKTPTKAKSIGKWALISFTIGIALNLFLLFIALL